MPEKIKKIIPRLHTLPLYVVSALHAKRYLLRYNA